MSRQEIYAWTSLLSSIAILIVYSLYTFGLPDNWSEIEGQLTSLFVKIFLFVLLVEITLGILKGNNEVEKDERDELIAGKGFRNAYLFLAVAVTILLFQIILDGFFGYRSLVFGTTLLVHVLVYILVFSSVTNRLTQIYFYRKM